MRGLKQGRVEGGGGLGGSGSGGVLDQLWWNAPNPTPLPRPPHGSTWTCARDIGGAGPI